MYLYIYMYIIYKFHAWGVETLGFLFFPQEETVSSRQKAQVYLGELRDGHCLKQLPRLKQTNDVSD